MRTEATSRRAPTTSKSSSRPARGRRREPDAPVRRGQRAADMPTRVEVEAEVDAPRQPSVRQLAAPMPIAAEEFTAAPRSGSRDRDAPALTMRGLFEEYLRVQVVSRLADHEVDRFAIEVAIEGASVEIHGVVPDALTSQLAEDLVWSVPAVRQCENRLRVGAPC